MNMAVLNVCRFTCEITLLIIINMYKIFPLFLLCIQGVLRGYTQGFTKKVFFRNFNIK